MNLIIFLFKSGLSLITRLKKDIPIVTAFSENSEWLDKKVDLGSNRNYTNDFSSKKA